MSRLGVCLVGAGFWAEQMHIPALRQIPGVEIVNVVTSSESSAAGAARRNGIPSWSSDLEQAIKDPSVGLVDIVAPPHVHADAAVLAAANGKDAICIKPLGRSVAEVDVMIAAAAAAGTRLFYAENVPFIPAIGEAKSLVDAGHIGDVIRVKATEGIGEPHSAWFFDPVKSGGGAALDMGVHSFAFCRHMASAPASTVFAETGTYLWQARTPAEDTALMTLRFANDVLGQCEDSWSLVGAMDSRFEIVGTKGRILIDNLHRQPLQVLSTAGSALAERGWSYPLPIPGLIADGHLAMLAHFVDCVRSGSPSRSDAQLGREAVQVIEAALKSASTGQRVSVHAPTGDGEAEQ